MGDAGKMAGRPINATDVIPKWDRTIERLGSQVIFVYPQSGGYAGTGDESVEGQGDKYRQVCGAGHNGYWAHLLVTDGVGLNMSVPSPIMWAVVMQC